MYLASFIFIENAIKYAEQFTKIDIFFDDKDHNTTEVRIANICKNISEDEMKKNI